MYRPIATAERHYGANVLKAFFAAAALHLPAFLLIPPFEFIPYRMGRDPLARQLFFDPALQGVVPVPALMQVPYTFSLR